MSSSYTFVLWDGLQSSSDSTLLFDLIWSLPIDKAVIQVSSKSSAVPWAIFLDLIQTSDSDTICFIEKNAEPDSSWINYILEDKLDEQYQAYMGALTMSKSSTSLCSLCEYNFALKIDVVRSIINKQTIKPQSLLELLWLISIEGYETTYLPSFSVKHNLKSQTILQVEQHFWSNYLKLRRKYHAYPSKGALISIDRFASLKQTGKRLISNIRSLNSAELVGAVGRVRALSGHLPLSRKDILFAPDLRKSNPYQTLFYEAVCESDVACHGTFKINARVLLKHVSECGFVHIHWIQALYKKDSSTPVQEAQNNLAWIKRLGYKLVWTVHNTHIHNEQLSEN